MDTEDQPANVGPTTFVPPAPAVADAGGDFISRFLALLHRLPRFPTGFLQRLPRVHEVVAMGLTVEEGAQALEHLVAQGHVVRQPVVQHAVGAAGQDDEERWKLHVDPVNPPVPPAPLADPVDDEEELPPEPATPVEGAPPVDAPLPADAPMPDLTVDDQHPDPNPVVTDVPMADPAPVAVPPGVPQNPPAAAADPAGPSAL